MNAAPAFAASKRLGGREAERDVDLGAALAERAAGLEAVPGERHLDRDVGRDGGELAAFGKHGLGIRRGDLGADGARHNVADVPDHLEEVAAGLGDKRGIGGHTVEQAGRCEIFDLGDVRRVYEKLHGAAPSETPRPAPALPVIGLDAVAGVMQDVSMTAASTTRLGSGPAADAGGLIACPARRCHSGATDRVP